MKNFILSILILLVFGCTENSYNKSKIAAVIENEIITNEEIDSVAAPQIRFLKKVFCSQ